MEVQEAGDQLFPVRAEGGARGVGGDREGGVGRGRAANRPGTGAGNPGRQPAADQGQGGRPASRGRRLQLD